MKKNFRSPEGLSIYFPPLCTHIVTSGQILGKSGVRYFYNNRKGNELGWFSLRALGKEFLSYNSLCCSLGGFFDQRKFCVIVYNILGFGSSGKLFEITEVSSIYHIYLFPSL